MGLAIVLFALFLLVLTALTFAVVRLFAGKDTTGRRDPAGCLVGCAVGVGVAVGSTVTTGGAVAVGDGVLSVEPRSTIEAIGAGRPGI